MDQAPGYVSGLKSAASMIDHLDPDVPATVPEEFRPLMDQPGAPQFLAWAVGQYRRGLLGALDGWIEEARQEAERAESILGGAETQHLASGAIQSKRVEGESSLLLAEAFVAALERRLPALVAVVLDTAIPQDYKHPAVPRIRDLLGWTEGGVKPDA